jgi:hypothetical protein
LAVKDNAKAPKKHRKVTVSGVLLLLLFIGVCAFGIFRLRLKWKLNARIEAIRAAGYPATCAELDAWYTIPYDAENAAYTILDALECFKGWDKTELESLPLVGRAELPARMEPLPDETKALIAEYIADNNEALDLFQAGAKIEHCRYPVDFNAGFAATLNHLPNMRRGVMLLNLEALLHAENGNADAAIRSVLSCFGLARSLSKEPCTISQMVRVGCHSLALSTIERMTNRIELTDELLIELTKSLYDAERTSDLIPAFVGERCMGLSFFATPETTEAGFLDGMPPRPIIMLCRAVGLVDVDAVIYLDLMNGYLEAHRLPYHQRQEAVDAVTDKLKSTSGIHIFVRALQPAMSRVTTIELRTIAHLRAARVGLAIQRYRLAAGALPDTLAELLPAYLDAVPKDPFDGNELRYKKREPGFVVYSINEDLHDDGGAEQLPRSKRPQGQTAPNWDITFIIER